MDNIRITSGNLRGRTLHSPKSDSTHPMGSREKIALFNMISDYLPGAKVLDAFAGSGALGIEALSRGAERAFFVEKSPKVAHTLVENLKSLNLTGASEIFVGEVKKYVAIDKFDVIIADPPYDKFELDDILYLTQFLKQGGILVLSHPEDAPKIPGLRLEKSKKYAGAHLSIFTF